MTQKTTRTDGASVNFSKIYMENTLGADRLIYAPADQQGCRSRMKGHIPQLVEVLCLLISYVQKPALYSLIYSKG